MDIHEYVYSEEDKEASNMLNFHCRYCNEKLIGLTKMTANNNSNFNYLERESSIHLMGCKIFGQARKLEIDEAV